MSSAARVSIILTEPQLAWLKAEAERLDIPVNELIRRIVDKARDA